MNGIIEKIEEEIKECELKLNTYKKIEIEILNKIPPFFAFVNLESEYSNFDFLCALAIINEKCDDISKCLKISSCLLSEINDKSDDDVVLKDFYDIANTKTKEEFNDDLENVEYHDPIEKYSLDKSTNILFDLLKCIDERDFDAFCTLITASKLVKELKGINASNKRRKELFLTVPEWKELFDKIEDKKSEYIRENRKRNKETVNEIDDLKELKNNLLKFDKQKEITNVREIINAIKDSNLKSEILKYIILKNEEYNNEILSKYNNLLKNSVSNYINLFGNNGLDFSSFDDNEKSLIQSYEYDYVKKVVKFLEKINYNFDKKVIMIIAKTSNEIIDKVDDYLKKDILNAEFIKNKINIIMSSNDTLEPSFELFINNMKVILSNEINLKGLDFDGMDFYNASTSIISNNIEFLNKNNINIRSRNLKNYNFLGEENLEDKVNELLKLNININDNLDILNADYNIINRIKICMELNIDIYDGKKINMTLLNKELFFIPDRKILEYKFERTLKID